MVEAGGVSFMDKVEAAAVNDSVAGDGIDSGGEEDEEMKPMEPLAEPPDDGGSVGWPMPEFCPLTIDGALKEWFRENIRKDAERAPAPQEDPEPEVASPESRPSSSKRHRAGTASPSSRSPYRNILQVFQQCKQDVVGEEAHKRNC